MCRLFFFYIFMKRALFLGLATLDIQYYVDVFPNSNVKIKSAPPEFFVGGPATNAAVAFAALNRSANLVTAIGDNSFKSVFSDDFERCHVNCLDVQKDKQIQPVLATVITSSDGDRTIFTHHPEKLNAKLDSKKLLDEINPEVVMLDGFYLEIAVGLAAEAKKRNIPVVFDGGSWKSHLPAILPFVDYAICSSDFRPPKTETPDDIFAFLDQYKISSKVISQGQEPILYQSSTQSGSIDVPKVEVLDTLGAGDFLHGAFCYYLLSQQNFKKALAKSALFASNTCSYRGTRGWLIKP